MRKFTRETLRAANTLISKAAMTGKIDRRSKEARKTQKEASELWASASEADLKDWARHARRTFPEESYTSLLKEARFTRRTHREWLKKKRITPIVPISTSKDVSVLTTQADVE